MLRLGHIIYSNCFPPHAGILRAKVDFPFTLVEGIPSELNGKLFDGSVDISPCSSIEYAAHRGRYLILPDFSISCAGSVKSIILQSRVPLADLGKKVIALTTASATSVVLLRILLEIQHGILPQYVFYKQGAEPPSREADAFLTIGDLAITQAPFPGFVHRYDLGELWRQYTGLPFVFALWQLNYRKNLEQELATLYDILKVSKSYGLTHLRGLSREEGNRFNIDPEVLYAYWNSFRYDFGPEEQKGLMAFYECAARIGAIESVPELRFLK